VNMKELPSQDMTTGASYFQEAAIDKTRSRALIHFTGKR
jgi:hypothetical protein